MPPADAVGCRGRSPASSVCIVGANAGIVVARGSAPGTVRQCGFTYLPSALRWPATKTLRIVNCRSFSVCA